MPINFFFFPENIIFLKKRIVNGVLLSFPLAELIGAMAFSFALAILYEGLKTMIHILSGWFYKQINSARNVNMDEKSALTSKRKRLAHRFVICTFLKFYSTGIIVQLQIRQSIPIITSR